MLTVKQEKFCINYFKLGNASEAGKLAGYSPKGARVRASNLLTKRNIQERIAQLQEKAASAKIMDVIERKERLSEIARANLTQFMELGKDGSWVNLGPETPNPGAIQEIHSRTEYDKDTDTNTVYTSVKLHDPIRAIDLLNKMEKIYSDNAGTTNINIDNRKVILVSDLTDEQLTNIIAIEGGSSAGTISPPVSPEESH